MFSQKLHLRISNISHVCVDSIRSYTASFSSIIFTHKQIVSKSINCYILWISKTSYNLLRWSFSDRIGDIETRAINVGNEVPEASLFFSINFISHVFIVIKVVIFVSYFFIVIRFFWFRLGNHIIIWRRCWFRSVSIIWLIWLNIIIITC